MVHSVAIEAEVLRRLLALHAAAPAGTAEPCALLLGEVRPKTIVVEGVVETANAHPRPDRAFAISPGVLLGAARRAREGGRSVVGAWHGHGERRAQLSSADAAAVVETSAAPGKSGEPLEIPFAYLISGTGAGRSVVLRAFVTAAGDVYEAPVRTLRPRDRRS